MERWKTLIQELHRRSVWQVLLVYLGASWAVLEVVDTLTDVLRLPGWFPDLAIVLLLVGLPFVLATAIIHGPHASGAGDDAGRTGDTGPPAAVPTTAAASRWLTWRNVLGAGVVVWAVWGVVAAVWLGVRPTVGTAEAAPTIAVLPLDDPASEAGSDWFATGMTDQLITDLSRIGSLSVINAPSTLSYQRTDQPLSEIGRELKAGLLLVGSVLRQSGAVRVNARLVDVATERLLWAESYQRPLDDVLALQAEVARAVAREVQGAVGTRGRDIEDARPTRSVDPDAHALYLEGRALYRRPSAENLSASIRLYRRALDIDPDFALAWAGMADSYLVAAHVNATPDEAFRASIDAALRALDLDPDLAEAHTALADSRYHFAFDYEAAEAGFRRAIELSPSYATARWWYGGLLATLGRFDESLAQIERGWELDPRAPIVPSFLARILYYARRYEDAAAIIRAADGAPYPLQAHGALAVYRMGQPEAALEMLAAGTSPYDMAARVEILAGTGRRAEARTILDRMHTLRDSLFIHPHLMAAAHVALGDRDVAIDWLETAYEIRDPALIWVHIDPAFDGLADDPRFQDLLARMGLAGVAGTGTGLAARAAGTALAALPQSS